MSENKIIQPLLDDNSILSAFKKKKLKKILKLIKKYFPYEEYSFYNTFSWTKEPERIIFENKKKEV